jgi:hypothetical protein
MHPIITGSLRNAALLILAALVFAGCKAKFNIASGSSTSSSDWTINGYRTSTRTHDGITRKLETANDIKIQNGRVTKFPKATLVKIRETGGSQPREAELRENAGKLELWIKDKGDFRKGSAEEEKWLEGFMGDFNSK